MKKTNLIDLYKRGMEYSNKYPSTFGLKHLDTVERIGRMHHKRLDQQKQKRGA